MGVSIVYTITLSGEPGTIAPTAGPLTFALVNGGTIQVAVSSTTGSATVHYNYGEFTSPIMNSIDTVSGGSEYELLVPNSAPTSVLANTTPVGSGSVSLTLSEAALDLVQDAVPTPADLAAGLSKGTAPTGRGETAQGSGDLSFTATGEAITVAFAAPSSLNWANPTVNGLLAGYSISWALNGNQLVGTLMNGVVPVGAAIYLALSGSTSALAGDTISPTVTATLSRSLFHSLGMGDVTVTGLKVLATDESGDVASGTVDLRITDDAPMISSVVNSLMANEVGSITAPIHAIGGADGIASYSFNSLGGLPSGWTVAGLNSSLLEVKDPSGNTIYQITANLDGTYTVNQLAARPGSLEVIQAANTFRNSPDPTYDFGFALFTALTQSTGGTVRFNASTSATGGNEFGLGNPAFTVNESFKIDFDAPLSNFTLGLGTVGNAGVLQFTVSDDSGHSITFTKPVTTASTSVTVAPGDVGFSFTHVTILGLDQTGSNNDINVAFKTVSYTESVAATDLTLTIGVIATDGDGDTSTGNFTFTSDGSSTTTNTIAGTAFADVISGLAGNDILTGEDGDDILIGGFGSDTMTGGAGADTFVIGADALGLPIDDLIADYSFGQGDTIDLSDLFATLGAGAPLTGVDADNIVQLVNNVNGTTSLQVDSNGTTSGGAMTEVATLNGTHSTIHILFTDTDPFDVH